MLKNKVHEEILGGGGVFRTVTIVVVPQVCVYVQTHQDAYIKYMQLSSFNILCLPQKKKALKINVYLCIRECLYQQDFFDGAFFVVCMGEESTTTQFQITH